MNRNSQWYNVLSKIEECRRDLEYILQQKTNLPLIEVDIVLNKLSLIYDMLMTIKLQTAVNEETGFLTRNSSLINKIIKESVFNNEDSHSKNEEKNEPTFSSETIKHENNSVSNQKETTESNSNYYEHKTESKTENKNIKTLADTFTKTNKTIAEMMEEIYKKKDISSSQQFKSIKDLKHAISINDKIMFIRELFNNDVDNYNYVLEQINMCNNLDEALAILDKNIKVQSDNEAIKQLLELVYRRFMN
ncbi:MAG: hypothetical protein N2449_05065 [Bacteroidales bacterium]|nr:hypothetical protein [Bacteroidales bacterium]